MYQELVFQQSMIRILLNKYKYLFLFDLLEYINNNFINNPKNQKSMIKYYFFIAKVMVL